MLYYSCRILLAYNKQPKNNQEEKKMKRFLRFAATLLSFAVILGFFSFFSDQAHADVTYVWPVPTSSQNDISLHFDEYWNGSYHKGIDITGYLGAPVVATRAGRVCRVLHGDLQGVYYDGGNVVVIDHYDGIYSHYAHLDSTAVLEGQTVEAGAVIGYMGTTGTSTGVHLHFALAYNSIGEGDRINNDPSVIPYVYPAPVITSARIVNKTSAGYDVIVTSTSYSGLSSIQIGTWHSGMSIDDAQWQTATPVNGTASFHVSYSSFHNPTNVIFYTNAFAFNDYGNVSEGIRAVEVVDLGNDFYATVVQDSSGGYLQNNGTKIITGLFPESSRIKTAIWHFRKQLDGDYAGSYEILSEDNGLCVDVANYETFNGNGINLLESVGNPAQRFYICLDREKGYNRYFFNSVLATSSLDVPGSYTALGATIQLWQTNFTDAQMFLINQPKWTIQYDANGGTGAPASQTKNYKTDITLSSSIPVRPYYRFLGWATSASSTVVAYEPGARYSREGDSRLYAVWEEIEDKILVLPSGLEVIGDEAFLNADAEIIVVPETVTQIGSNAFGDVVIYGYLGSTAETYAADNSLTFVPVG